MTDPDKPAHDSRAPENQAPENRALENSGDEKSAPVTSSPVDDVVDGSSSRIASDRRSRGYMSGRIWWNRHDEMCRWERVTFKGCQ